MTDDEIKQADLALNSLEKDIVRAATIWNMSKVSANFWKDKGSRLKAKQDERKLREACDVYHEALLSLLSQLGQDQE